MHVLRFCLPFRVGGLCLLFLFVAPLLRVADRISAAFAMSAEAGCRVLAQVAARVLPDFASCECSSVLFASLWLRVLLFVFAALLGIASVF